MQCRVWHLLREPGPDTGFLPPVVGDYNMAVVQRDLNIWTGRFIGETGLASQVSDRQVTVPVYATADQPVPPDMQSLYGIDYNPAGQQSFPLIGVNMKEWNAYCADITLSVGQPSAFREQFAGYVRLFPTPGPGQEFGPGIGAILFGGIIHAGDTAMVTLTNPPNAPVIVPTYVVKAGDTLATVAQNVAQLINNSNAVVGNSAFLQQCATADNQIQLTAINAPGTQIMYLTTLSAGAMLTVTPHGTATLAPNGDTLTFYYSSTGSMLIYPGDTTEIPPQLQMAPVYGVLSDYWTRKNDPAGNADRYYAKYEKSVEIARRLGWDANRAAPQTFAGFGDGFDYDLRGW